MLLGTLAAYAFARCNIPRKRTLLLVLGSQLLSAVSLIIPLFSHVAQRRAARYAPGPHLGLFNL